MSRAIERILDELDYTRENRYLRLSCPEIWQMDSFCAEWNREIDYWIGANRLWR